MGKRVAARAGLIFTFVLIAGTLAVPSQAGGRNSTPEMTIDVCSHSVEATSTKDISNVKVYFTDGTQQEIHPDSGGTFEQTFEQTIDFATAKSGNTEVRDEPGDCGEATSSSDADGDGTEDTSDDGTDDTSDDTSDDGTDDSSDDGTTSDDGSGDTSGDTSGDGSGDTSGDGTSDTSGDGTGDTSGDGTTSGGSTGDAGGDGTGGTGDTSGGTTDSTSGGTTGGTTGTTTGGTTTGGTTETTTGTTTTAPTELCPSGTTNAGLPMTDLTDCFDAEVLAMAQSALEARNCPAAPYKGMPFTDIGDCAVGKDVVLAFRMLRNQARGGALSATGFAALVPFIIAALGAIGAGTLILRRRRPRHAAE